MRLQPAVEERLSRAVRHAARTVWWLTCASAWSCLLSCADSQSGALDKKTDWLQACSANLRCDEGFECVCGVCSAKCERDGDCTALATEAICVAATALAPSCAVEAERGACALPCEDRAECADWNASLACLDGICASGADEQSASTTDDGGARPVDGVVAYQINAAHTGAQTGDTFVPPLEPKWDVDLGLPVTSYPLIADGRVFVSLYEFGNNPLLALDAEDGRVLWGPHALGGTYGFSASAYDNGRVYAVNDDGLVHAFDASNGALAWRVQLVTGIDAPPTATQELVLVHGNVSLTALEQASGEVVWSRPVSTGSYGAAAVADGRVFTTYACQDAWANDLYTGAFLWRHVGSCGGSGFGTPVVFEDRVFAMDVDPYNGIFQAVTGEILGTYAGTASPAFDAARRGFFVDSNALRALDMESDAELWSLTADGYLSPPATANGYVYVASIDTLYAIDAATGAIADSVAMAGADVPGRANWGEPRGLAIGGGKLIVPAGTHLVAY